MNDPDPTGRPESASPPDPPRPGDLPSSAGAPLVQWVSPTRGYVAGAAIAGVVLLLAGSAWQLWLLVAGGPSARGSVGWSVASMVVLALAVVVLIELSRRPQPRAAGPRDRARQARARTPAERRVVRRAMWHGELPASRRLQRAAAHRVEPAASNVLLIPLYLLMGAAALGFAAAHGAQASSSGPALMGVLWTGGSLLLLGMLAWLRRQATRLQRAWEAASTTEPPRPARQSGARRPAVTLRALDGPEGAAVLVSADADERSPRRS